MYDSHIFCSEYSELKDTIVDIINGDDTTTDVEQLADHIQALYEDGKIAAVQYDDLMRYIQDLI